MTSNLLRVIRTSPRARSLATLLAAALMAVSCGGGSGGDGTAPSAQFTPLGMLAGYTSSSATALAADGSVAAGYAEDGAGHAESFRWTAGGGLIAIGRLTGGAASRANAISSDGSVIVGSGDTTANPPASSAAFRWSSAGGMQRVTPLAGAKACAAGDVSGDGALVVGVCLVSGNMGFRWTQAGGPVALGVFGSGMGAASNASAVSRDGLVIGGSGDPRLTGAMLWPASGSPVFIGRVAGDDTFASVSSLSRDGAVAAGISVDAQGAPHMFRWTAASGMARLAGLPGTTGQLVGALSGDGAAIVGWGESATQETALIWDAALGTRTLAAELASRGVVLPAGWTLSRALAISDDGRTIAGQGIDPQGRTQGWLIRLTH